MHVVLYGATGNAGSRILKELVARGHQVTIVVRDTAKVPAGTASKQGDLSNVDTIAECIAGADAVVSAYAPPHDNTDALVGVTERLVAAVKKIGKTRLIIVGGAGLLEVAPGVSLLASGHLPAAWVPIATSHDKAQKVLVACDINWTYFSPAAYFEPGERTGKFRLGTKELVAMEDYAVALVDELEKPAHERASFSIGY
jgi:putative NADH-flavin reductase